MTVVGSAIVEIRAISPRFNKDIEKSLQSSLGSAGRDLGKQLGDDFSKEFNKTLKTNLKNSKTEIPEPDTEKATKKLRLFGKEVDRVYSRMRRGGSTISSFNQQLRKMDDHLLQSLGSIVKFGGGFSGLMMTLDSAGAIIGSLIGPLSALTSGIFALGSAIAPAAKSAALLPGFIAALVTPAISATLALSGLGKAYTAGAAAAAGGKKELEKYKEALKKLNPQQAEFVEHLLEHKGAIDAVKNSASEKIFDGLSRALDNVVGNGFLDILSDGLREAGGALGHVANEVAKLTGKEFFQRAFGRVMESNVVIIENLGGAFRNLIGYLTLVADAAAPFTEEFSEWIRLITGNWLNSARGNMLGLRNSIGDGVRVAKQLGDIFGNIWNILGNIGRAARPAGQILLNAFEGATEAFEKWTGDEKNQDRMEKFFLRVADTTRAIGRLLVSVVREFVKLGDNPAFVGMINTLAESTVPKLAESMDKLVSAVGDDFVGILDTLADIGAVMADSGGLESYLEVMQVFLDIIKNILGIPGFAELAGHILAITGALKALAAVSKFTGLTALATTILPGLTSKKTGAGVAAGKVTALKNALKGLSTAAAPLFAITAALELVRTNPATGTGENPGEGEGSLFPKAPKFLDDFTKSIGDPKSEDKEAIRGWFRKLFEGANINIPWDRIWEKSRLPEMARNISRTFNQVKNNIGNFFGAIPGFVTRMRENAESGLSSFRSWVTNLFKSAGRGITTAWNTATSWVGRTTRNMKQGVEDTLTRFRASVTNAFRTVARVSSRIWNGIVSSVTGAARSVWRGVSSAFNGLRISIGNTFNRIRGNIVNIWNGVSRFLGAVSGNIYREVQSWFQRILRGLGRTFARIRANVVGVWRAVARFLGSVAGNIYKDVVDRFQALRSSVVRTFNRLRIGVASAWGKIRAAAREPVEYVVNTVFNNGLRRAVNRIHDVIPAVPYIPELKFGGGSKTGGSRPASDRGFSAGGYTGPGSKYQPAGVVHADEFVIKKSSRKKIEQQLPGLLDFMNKTGKLPGYASGGLVAAANWWRKLGARASEHPAFGGVRAGHMKGSLHYSGRAVDLNYGPGGQSAQEMAFFDRNLREFRSKFRNISVIWRAPGHFNHMHIDTGGYSKVGKGGGGGGGSSLPSLAGLLNPIRGLRDKLRTKTGKGLLGKTLRAVGSSVLSKSIGVIKDKYGTMAEKAGEAIGRVVGNIKSGSTRAIVQGLAAARGWGGGRQWAALDKLINKESGWNPNAANKTSSARGLFQKMTSVHGPIEKSVAGQAQWGLNYIKKRYGSPLKAWGHSQRTGWYADGGRVAPINYAGVFDTGGILEPGMNLVNNKLGHREQLVRPELYNPKGLAAEYRALTRVIEKAFGASGRMVSAGSRIVSGLVEGMRTGTRDVSLAATEMSNAAVSATQGTLDIHSPSRVFEKFGLYIIDGLVQGVSSGRDRLAKAINNTLKNVTDYTAGRTKKAVSDARALVTNMGEVTKGHWDQGTNKGLRLIVRTVEKFQKASVLWRKVTLGDLAKGAELLGAKLQAAREKAAGLSEEFKDMSSGIAGGIIGSLDLSAGEEGSTLSFSTVSTRIKELAEKAKKLAPKLQKLIKNGMPKAFVQEIAGLGIDNALAVADAILAGTTTEQKRLFADYNEVGSNATAVGNIVASQMYNVGKSAQAGLIKGLEADQKKLTDAAKKLANKLEYEVKKELGIKSPSRVFALIGEYLPLGLAQGIDSSIPSAVSAIRRLSNEVTSAFVPDLRADRSSAGSALISTATRRSTAAVEEVDENGLTAQARAIIEAIESLQSGTTMVLNPPPEMDIFTLAKLVARELEFRGM